MTIDLLQMFQKCRLGHMKQVHIFTPTVSHAVASFNLYRLQQPMRGAILGMLVPIAITRRTWRMSPKVQIKKSAFQLDFLMRIWVT